MTSTIKPETILNLPVGYSIKNGKLYNLKGEVAFIYSEGWFDGRKLNELTGEDRYNPEFILDFMFRHSDVEMAKQLEPDATDLRLKQLGGILSNFTVSWLTPGKQYYLHDYDTRETLMVVDEDFGFIA